MATQLELAIRDAIQGHPFRLLIATNDSFVLRAEGAPSTYPNFVEGVLHYAGISFHEASDYFTPFDHEAPIYVSAICQGFTVADVPKALAQFLNELAEDAKAEAGMA